MLFRSVFSEVYLVDVYYSSNQILFASMNPDMITDFEDKCLQLPQADLSSMMERVDANMIKYEAGNLLLTDDKAPVELLGMNVIDALIQEELGYYKEAFETNGIEGILGSQ